jgi:uncharacterized membrane protein
MQNAQNGQGAALDVGCYDLADPYCMAFQPSARATHGRSRSAAIPYEESSRQQGFIEAFNTVIGNCSMCHARTCVGSNMQWAPESIWKLTQLLHATPAKSIYRLVSATQYHHNAVDGLEARATLVAWVREVRAEK